MARLNIDDRLYTDQRFLDLVQKLGAGPALGELIRCWIIAQQYWKHEDPIPFEIWAKQRLSDAIIDVGLAVKEEAGVYVRGSKDYFGWLKKAVDSGKRGGLASADARRSDFNSLGPRDPSGTLKGFQPSYSYSSSSSKENTGIQAPSRKSAQAHPHPMSDFEQVLESMGPLIKTWEELYSAEYVVREIKKALIWLTANPKKNKKTYRGWVQFFSNWFDRGWDKTTTRGPSTRVLDDWQEKATKILDGISRFGGHASADIEALQNFLGPELHRVARSVSGGILGLRQIPRNEYTVNKIAGLLKESSQRINQGGNNGS